MNNGTKAIAALTTLAGWGVLVVATASAFSFGAALWLTLRHASLSDAMGILPWRDAALALLSSTAWFGLRRFRSRLEARISAEEPGPLDQEALAERVRSGRVYQWFLALFTVAVVLTALALHSVLGSSRERFNEILLWLIALQVIVTLSAFAFFSYGVDIRRLFQRDTGRSGKER